MTSYRYCRVTKICEKFVKGSLYPTSVSLHITVCRFSGKGEQSHEIWFASCIGNVNSQFGFIIIPVLVRTIK